MNTKQISRIFAMMIWLFWVVCGYACYSPLVVSPPCLNDRDCKQGERCSLEASCVSRDCQGVACQDASSPPDELADTPVETPAEAPSETPTLCQSGERRACYTGAPGTAGIGVCASGSQLCNAGVWGDCLGSVVPQPDLCDGVDNDCDGQVDNQPGGGALSRLCYSAQEGCLLENGAYRCEGPCQSGLAFCRDGLWSACEREVTPATEICDGIDNNCNGEIDEQISCPVCRDPCQNDSDCAGCGQEKTRCAESICVAPPPAANGFAKLCPRNTKCPSPMDCFQFKLLDNAGMCSFLCHADQDCPDVASGGTSYSGMCPPPPLPGGERICLLRCAQGKSCPTGYECTAAQTSSYLYCKPK